MKHPSAGGMCVKILQPTESKIVSKSVRGRGRELGEGISVLQDSSR